LAATPFGALPGDTAEYMLGDVYVTLVLIESSAQIDVNNDNSETWTQADNGAINSIPAVKRKIVEGLQWWEETLAGITDKHHLQFHIDFTHADTPFISGVEPITQQSGDTDIFVNEFLRQELPAGTRTGLLSTDVRAFNHQQREANDANWAFTIFVVNDENDADHKFAQGGLQRAFAFPGGLYMVTLASRPASTTAHETGHIFWAYDEYTFSGATYNDTRGYYNTQNTNAATGHPNPGTRVASIMERGACAEGGGLLCDAYQQNTSSQPSLEMIGWRDSDGNGVFDVLDVPHTLSGSGSYNSTTGNYHFVGESSVNTLPNLNPREQNLSTESLQSDITINEISRAQFRVDGGAWQTAAVYDAYSASLDLTFPVASGAGKVEIRTVDDATGVASPVFGGSLSRPTSVSHAGINGFVFTDLDRDGELETGEPTIAGRVVRLVDAAGQPISLESGVEPDDFAEDSEIGNAVAGVTLTSVGDNVSTDAVYAHSASPGTQGTKVFAFQNTAGIQTTWTAKSRELKITPAALTTTVSIDAIGTGFGLGEDFGRLEIYDAANNLLARYTTAALGAGAVERMTLSRPTADISYAIATSHASTSVRLDDLRLGPQASVMTDDHGAYSISYLEPGDYSVQALPPQGSTSTSGTIQTVTLSAGESAASIDFGFTAFVSPWQNQRDPNDVDDDGFVSPLDVLLIINNLNEKGARLLSASDTTPPFLDVDGDSFVAPVDVLLVINANEANASEGEAKSEAASSQVSTRLSASETAVPLLKQLTYPGDSSAGLFPAAEAAESSSKATRTTPGDPRADLTTHVSESRPVAERIVSPSSAAASTDLFEAMDLDTTLSIFAEEIAQIWCVK
jgi:hypothetical protein